MIVSSIEARMAIPEGVIDGRYRIEEELGSGGFGVVFRARHIALERDVAIKVLLPTADDPALQKRFQREARCVALLDHQNCVHVTDYGTLANGTSYLVMELIAGHPLSAELGRSWSPTRAIDLTLQLLEGLDHAHRLGLVHRDLKPDNILLTTDADGNERAKIIDFGIVKIIAGAEAQSVELTAAGRVPGTPGYMSPEQGTGGSVDARSDLYCVGLLLYEMLAGSPPFAAGDPRRLAWQHAVLPVEPLSEQLPSGLRAFVDRLLAKKADERHASARMAIEHLRALHAGLGQRSPPRETGGLHDTVPSEVRTELSAASASGEPSFADAGDPGEPAFADVGGAMSFGASVDRYLVLSKLGEGGMGLVLSAYDPVLDRKVALKLIRPRGGDQSRNRARLQREAQALAKLDHRNVVSVYDVGEHLGQLFLAMEFVAGQDLRSWLSSADEPHPWRTVIGVFTSAGRGLAAAHAAGMVHRDFKPANVMLGDDGRVRVMDFGLVRAEEDEIDLGVSLGRARSASGTPVLVTPMTGVGAILGTPAYMSLEQFEGQPADARADQFGFCVALYEALYGERPFGGNSTDKLVAAMESGEIRDPPKGSKVPGWVRKVVVRGLAAVRDERYPSMDELLVALGDDPAHRWRRRVGVVAAVALLAGISWWSLASQQEPPQPPRCADMDARLAGIWDDRRRASVERGLTDGSPSQAPETWARVEARLDAYARAWVVARTKACEASVRGEQSGELLDLRMACLDERLSHVRATVRVLEAADETAVSNAVEAVLGLPRLERCADTTALRAELPPPEDPSVAREVERLDEQLINARAHQGAGNYRRALLLIDAVIERAAVLDYEPLKARAWLQRGGLQTLSGDYEAAETSLKLAYDAALAQQMIEPAASAAGMLTFAVGVGLGRYQDGQRWAANADPLARAVGTDEFQAKHLGTLGALAHSVGAHEDARRYHQRALAIEQQLGAGDPRVASSHTNLGIVANSEGRHDDARGHYQRALLIQDEALGPHHPDVAITLNNLSMIAFAQGEYEEARGYLRRARAIWEAALGPDNPNVAYALTGLGDVAQALGKPEDAREHQQHALAIWEAALGPDHPLLPYPLTGLGDSLLSLDRPGEALPHLERARNIRSAAEGDPSSLARTHMILARALWDAPVDGGRDRPRALELAELAREVFGGDGQRWRDEHEAVEAWLLEHRGEQPGESTSEEPRAD